MRVSDASLYGFFTRRFADINSRSARALEQLADGKKVRYASDDVGGARSALGLRARLARIAGYERTADRARFDLETIEDALGRTFDLLIEARTKAQAGTGAGADPEALAVEVDALRDELLALSNTFQDGRYLFAGTEALTQPFDDAGVYAGDDAETQAPLDEGVTVGTTLSGQRVFLDGGDLFAALDALATALRAGDNAAIEQAAVDFQGYLDHVGSIRGEIGVRLVTIETVLDRQADEQLRLTRRVSEIEDAPLEETAVELTAAGNTYDAFGAAASRILSRSLLDFLG